MRGTRSAVLLLLTAACTTIPRGLPPATLRDLPWGDSPADQTLLQAREAMERGEPRAALTLVGEVLAARPHDVDARRLRQDLLRQRGRTGLLLAESDEALQRNPDDGIAWYLRGRLVDRGEDKLRCFSRAVELAPDRLWPWLGLAHTLRAVDGERALSIYAQLYRGSGQHPVVAVAYAAALREVGRLDAAAAVYAALRPDRRVAGVGDLGLAQVWLQQDQRPKAWTALLSALRQRPFDPGVQSLIAGWIASGASEDQEVMVLDVLREDPARLAAFARGDGATVLAPLLQRQGQSTAARRVLASVGPGAAPQLQRLARRLALAVGDVDAFLQMVTATVPRELVAAEANELRGRWLVLLDGPWQRGEPLASPAQALALLDALFAVGLLQEVELLAELVLQRWPDAAAAAERRDDARRELAFAAGLRRLLYGGYDHHDTRDLAAVLDALRALSQQVFGRDVVGAPTVYSVPMVGEMVDPFSGPLAEHLARCNRHLVLGRRSGGTVEGLLLTRLSVAELPAAAELALPGRCFEVVGIDRDIKSLGGVVGGDLAGVALLNHFLIDHDAVQDWARSLADRRRIAAEDGGALRQDPLPADARGAAVDVAWRLAVLSPVQDKDLAGAVMAMIRCHERQHLVDSFHYLPVERNVWRGLGLLLQFGFSPSAIEAEMERRAELAALAVSPHPELVLAHVADFLGEPGADSAHHRGFGQLAQDLAIELQALGVDAAAAAPCRWHELETTLVRAAAERLLARR
ncbi:MAG: hypothetical protein IT455_03555 [Planctomycetes bacterium]|nr:hypothetical protein [Planctomycetota bacterium]